MTKLKIGSILRTAIGRKKAEALTRDPVLFVRSFDREPWPYQAELLRQVTERDDAGKFTKRVAVVSMPRQNGKSTLSAWLGLWALYCLPDQSIVTVANDYPQSRIIFRDARKIVSGSGILFELVDRFTRDEIVLKSGARWIVKSSDAVSSRGLRPSIVLYDELGWSPDRELFDVLSAAQAAQDNPLSVVTSTVGPVQAGILWELFELAREDDPAIRLIYHQDNLSPKITEEFLEQQRALLPGPVYAREHLNTWGAGSEAFCTLPDWQRAIGDADPRKVEDNGPSAAYLDLGWVHDETALAIGKREGDKVRILHMEAWQGSQEIPVDFASVEARIIELKQRLNITQLTIESPQGVGMAQRLDVDGLRAETYHPTAKGQRELWGGLYTALKAGDVWLPNDAKLRRQLLTLTIKATATGWKTIDDPSVHQDRAVACAGVLGLCQRQQEPAGEIINDIPMENYKYTAEQRERRQRRRIMDQIPRVYHG